MCTKDNDGNAVSLIQSNFHGIGSTIGVDDLGFFLHNRGAGFNLIQNHPNSLNQEENHFIHYLQLCGV